MCGRYRLTKHWQYDANGVLRLVRDKVDVDDPAFEGRDEAAPRDRMPIVRRDGHGDLAVDLRHWGFVITVAGKTVDPATGLPKRLRRDVFNAQSEKLTTSFQWRFAFAERRCLVPMSSWDEWPEIGAGAGKQRVRVSMPGEPVFAAAGLYETSRDPRTNEKLPTFTIVTVPPNEFLGTVHDRAPMVLRPEQYEAWLDGGDAARRLIGVHPDVDAFAVKVV